LKRCNAWGFTDEFVPHAARAEEADDTSWPWDEVKRFDFQSNLNRAIIVLTRRLSRLTAWLRQRRVRS
jgi:hypothetical protein